MYCKTGNFHVHEIFMNFGRFAKISCYEKKPTLEIHYIFLTRIYLYLKIMILSCRKNFLSNSNRPHPIVVIILRTLQNMQTFPSSVLW